MGEGRDEPATLQEVNGNLAWVTDDDGNGDWLAPHEWKEDQIH